MIASQKAIDLIKRFEGLELKAYVCPGGKWTVGYGHTKDVEPNSEIIEDLADCYLKNDAKEVEDTVNYYTDGIELNQNQFDALVSFVFNVGGGNFERSTMLRYLSIGAFEEAGDEFKRWKYAGKKELAGLVRRRKAETELFKEEMV